MPVLPFASVLEFKAYPHDLALSTVLPGGSAAVQDAVILGVLNTASREVTNILGRDYAAGTRTVTVRVRVDADCTIRFVVPERRLVKVVSAAFAPYAGATPTAINVATAVVAGESGAVVYLPAPAGPGQRGFLTITYVGGYANTVLPGATSIGSSITVADASAILPGDDLYLADSSGGERVTVTTGYATGSNPVTLDAPVVRAHDAGAACSGLPDDLRHATILWACGLLARPSSGGAAAGDPFAGAPRKPTAGKGSGGRQGSGVNYFDRARVTLASWGRVPL